MMTKTITPCKDRKSGLLRHLRVWGIALALSTTFTSPAAAAPLVAIIAGPAFAATIGGQLLGAAIGIGASFLLSTAVNAIFGGKKDNKDDKGDTVQYGDRVSRSGVFGTRRVQGHLVHLNEYDSSKMLQYVVVLGDCRHTDLVPSIYVNGRQVAMTETATSGNNEHKRYTVNGYGNDFVVRFHDGRVGQAADTNLVNRTSGWTSAKKYSNMAYAVCEIKSNKEKFNGIPQIELVLRGLRCYDIRKDSSVGGSGTHRFNDPDTWEYTANPAVQAYHFARGFFFNGIRVLGAGLPAARLLTDYFIAAMNVCDQVVNIPGGGTRKRYEAHLEFRDTDTFADVLTRLCTCMGGYHTPLNGNIAIYAGIAQSPVMTITDADLVEDVDVEWNPGRAPVYLFSGVQGVYTHSTEYTTVPYQSIEPPEFLNPNWYPRVTDFNLEDVQSSHQAWLLAKMYLFLNRLQITASFALDVKDIILQAGDWITWNSNDTRGSRQYKVASVNYDLKALRMYIEVGEISADAFADDATAGDIVQPARPRPAPSYIDDVDDFTISAVTILGADSTEAPGLEFGYTPIISDPGVVSLTIYYRVQGTSEEYKATDFTLADGIYRTTNNVVGGKRYEAYAELQSIPGREMVHHDWTDKVVAATDTPLPVTLATSNSTSNQTIEIVNSLPVTGNYEGRLVFLTTDDKLYRHTGSAWTTAVPTVDLTGQITTTQITDAAVTTDKLINNAVTTDKIIANAITEAKLLNGAVTNSKVANLAIDTAKLADLAVNTSKLANLAVDTSKLADASVSTVKIVANAVTADKILANSILASKMIITDMNNFVGNPSFITGDQTGWLIASGPATNMNVLPASNPAVPANAPAQNVMQFLPSGGTLGIMAGDLTYNANNGSFFPVVPGDQYRISLDVARVGAVTGNFLLSIYGRTTAGGSYQSTGTSFTSAINTTWSTISRVFKVPVGVERIRADIPWVLSAGGEIYWTNARLQRINGGDLIVDGAITASKMVVANFDNLVPNPAFQTGNLASWVNNANNPNVAVIASSTVGVPANPPTANVARFSPGSSNLGLFAGNEVSTSLGSGVPVVPGEEYQFGGTFAVSATMTAGTLALFARGINAAGVVTNVPLGAAINTALNAVVGAWVNVSRNFIVPAGWVEMRWFVSWQGTNTGGPVFLTNASLRKRYAGELIVDGTIQTNHLAASSVTAAKILAGTITATELAAGSVTTPKIAAAAVTANEIATNAITADKILANAIIAGKIDVGAINASAIIVDGILLTPHYFTNSIVRVVPVVNPTDFGLTVGVLTKVVEATITPDNGIVIVDGRASFNSSADTRLRFGIWKNGSQVLNEDIDTVLGGKSGGGSLVWVDTSPGTSANTYALYAESQWAGIMHVFSTIILENHKNA